MKLNNMEGKELDGILNAFNMRFSFILRTPYLFNWVLVTKFGVQPPATLRTIVQVGTV